MISVIGDASYIQMIVPAEPDTTVKAGTAADDGNSGSGGSASYHILGSVKKQTAESEAAPSRDAEPAVMLNISSAAYSAISTSTVDTKTAAVSGGNSSPAQNRAAYTKEIRAVSSHESEKRELAAAIEELSNGQQLSVADYDKIRRMRQKEVMIQAHEMTHLMQAREYALGSATYNYETGPDGKRYVVSGRVDVDVRIVPNDPDKTMEKADILIQAATGPVDPSPADFAMAARAAIMKMYATGDKKSRQAQKRRESEMEEQRQENIKKIFDFLGLKYNGSPFLSPAAKDLSQG